MADSDETQPFRSAVPRASAVGAAFLKKSRTSPRSPVPMRSEMLLASPSSELGPSAVTTCASIVNWSSPAPGARGGHRGYRSGHSRKAAPGGKSKRLFFPGSMPGGMPHRPSPFGCGFHLCAHLGALCRGLAGPGSGTRCPVGKAHRGHPGRGRRSGGAGRSQPAGSCR